MAADLSHPSQDDPTLLRRMTHRSNYFAPPLMFYMYVLTRPVHICMYVYLSTLLTKPPPLPPRIPPFRPPPTLLVFLVRGGSTGTSSWDVCAHCVPCTASSLCVPVPVSVNTGMMEIFPSRFISTFCIYSWEYGVIQCWEIFELFTSFVRKHFRYIHWAFACLSFLYTLFQFLTKKFCKLSGIVKCVLTRVVET